MKLLAIDASADELSLALSLGPQLPAFQLEMAAGAAASAKALSGLEKLLDQAGVTVSALDAIAFGQGPGAFTGLRTACAVAQGLAMGACKPMIPVDSLAAVAQDAWEILGNERSPGAKLALGGQPAWVGAVVMDARMGEVYVSHFEYPVGAGSISEAKHLHAPALFSPAQLLERWSQEPVQLLAGSALKAYPELNLPGVLALPGARPRASAMLPLARALFAQGKAVDAGQAAPLYVRDKVAQTVAERMELKRSQQAAASAVPVRAAS